MKISQKQAYLLAKEVFEKLKKTGQFKVSELMVAKLEAWQEKRNKLCDLQREASSNLHKHDATLKQITGNVSGLYSSDTINQMVEKIKNKSVPTISQIEDKIILKQMFATDMDMEEFIQSIVKEFTKRKAVTQN